MSQKRACSSHGFTIYQCRCPCPDVTTYIPCNDHCPDFGEPEDAMMIHKIDASMRRWKDLAERQEKELDNLRSLFRRVWRCEVASSGYHNGATCTPDDAHFGWACEYRWIAPALGEEQAKKLGLTE